MHLFNDHTADRNIAPQTPDGRSVLRLNALYLLYLYMSGQHRKTKSNLTRIASDTSGI